MNIVRYCVICGKEIKRGDVYYGINIDIERCVDIDDLCRDIENISDERFSCICENCYEKFNKMTETFYNDSNKEE